MLALSFDCHVVIFIATVTTLTDSVPNSTHSQSGHPGVTPVCERGKETEMNKEGESKTQEGYGGRLVIHHL